MLNLFYRIKLRKLLKFFKTKVTDKVNLSKFDSLAKLLIETDASFVGVSAVLLQKHKNNKIKGILR